MSQQHNRAPAHDRDRGVRRVGRLTWRVGLIGAACSAVLTLAFGHHAAAANTGSAQHRHNSSTILIPASPPAAATGGGQVTSGSS